MKAVIINKYGSANELVTVELPKPSIKPNEVLVKNHYVSVNPWDSMVRSGSMKLFTGSKFPKILGTESAGIVEEVGEQVRGFKKGDRVIATTGKIHIGSYSEYIAVPETSLAKLPDNVNFQSGATLPVAASTAYNSLHELANIKKGDEVLINGAFGGVGSAAVQVAKIAGATVTAVCSTRNVENVRLLGADHVMDYTKDDLYQHVEKYDIIFDTVNKMDFSKAKKTLKQGGIMVGTLPTLKAMTNQFRTSWSSKKFKAINNYPTAENISLLARFVAEGKLKVVIDREFSLDELPQAHQYSETGKVQGKIVVKI